MPSDIQEPIETRIYREQQRQQIVLHYRHKCPLCGRFANEMHEMVFRSRTLYNVEARRLSFQKELCVMLDSGCHAQAHTAEITSKLLRANIRTYGYEAVRNALAAVQAHLKGKLGVELPEQEDAHE